MSNWKFEDFIFNTIPIKLLKIFMLIQFKVMNIFCIIHKIYYILNDHNYYYVQSTNLNIIILCYLVYYKQNIIILCILHIAVSKTI